MSKGQEGYSMTELLIAIVITGMIAGVLATTVYQFSVVSTQGTNRLTALDETQNIARWVARDVHGAVEAGTQLGCSSDCQTLTLTIPDPSGVVTYTPPDPDKGHVFGTYSYENDTILYFTDDSDFKRKVNGGGTQTIAQSVSVNFTTITFVSGSRDRHFVTMDITAPVAHGDDVVEQIHLYLQATDQ